MRPRFLWILVLGAVVAAVAVGGFALERTGVIGSGGRPAPPAQERFDDNVVDEGHLGADLKPDNHISTADENEPDESEGGRGPAANENEPDENDRGD
jgi:hypothetical protein